VPQVHSECWLESPLTWMAQIVGRYDAARKELKSVKAHVSAAR
jgi:hypothetical protein